MPQPVLTALQQEGAEFLLRPGGSLGVQRHPSNRLAPGVILDGDPGDNAAIALPEAANWVLAVIEDLRVSVLP